MSFLLFDQNTVPGISRASAGPACLNDGDSSSLGDIRLTWNILGGGDSISLTAKGLSAEGSFRDSTSGLVSVIWDCKEAFDAAFPETTTSSIDHTLAVHLSLIEEGDISAHLESKMTLEFDPTLGIGDVQYTPTLRWRLLNPIENWWIIGILEKSMLLQSGVYYERTMRISNPTIASSKDSTEQLLRKVDESILASVDLQLARAEVE